MTDDRLRLSLRVVDAPVQPSELFAEDLHARLAAELGLGVQTTAVDSVRAPARPDVRRRGRVGWLAVAALLVLALLGLVLGQQGRTPEPPPTGSSSFNATATPSSQPTPLPSSTAPTAPAIAESSPALDNLRSDGLVLYELGAMDGIPRLRVLQPDLSSVELLPGVPGLQFGAAWRPDGERLAFTSYDAVELRSHPLIWETDAEGAEPILLSEGCDLPTCVAESEPSYSPDGTRLVFVRTRVEEGAEEESVVAIRDLETGEITELTATSRPRSGAKNFHPRWSPDGQTIAYGVSSTGIRRPGEAAGSTIQRCRHRWTATVSDPTRTPGRRAGMVSRWSRRSSSLQPFRRSLQRGTTATRPASPVHDASGWIDVRQFPTLACRSLPPPGRRPEGRSSSR